MGKFDGCILACDVDGTLVSNGVLPERNVPKIIEFTKEGGIFALATGRSPIAVKEAVAGIKRYIGPSVVTNGSVVYDFANQKEIVSISVANDAKEVICEASEKFKKVGIEIHCGTKVFNINPNSDLRLHQSYESFCGKDVNARDIIFENWNKLVLIADEFRWCEEIIGFIKSKNNNFHSVHTNAVIKSKMRDYIEILPNGANKAAALKQLCKMLNIKKGGYFAIGDFYNDIEMLSAADIAACPCDSPDEIKKHADYLTAEALDGAVAHFIEYLQKEIK